MIELKLIQKLPEHISPIPRVTALLEKTQDDNGQWFLRAQFQVQNAKLNAKATYPKDKPAWGLWDSDVCELFISSSQNELDVGQAPYFEFQVSPFAQYFELKVTTPREVWDEDFRSGVRVSAKVRTTQAWNGQIEVPLQALGLQPDAPLFGNITACLLREPHRAYMAHAYEPDVMPDFHKPARFVKII